MASTMIPHLICHSRVAVAAVLLLTFLVAVIEVPRAAMPKAEPAPAAWA